MKEWKEKELQIRTKISLKLPFGNILALGNDPGLHKRVQCEGVSSDYFRVFKKSFGVFITGQCKKK